MSHLRQRLEAAKSGTVSVLAEGAGSICLEDVEPEAADPGEHAWAASDTGAILAEGDVAGIVGGCLNAPMHADCFRRLGGKERLVGDVERNF